jgi:hypothetical protein
MRLIIHSSICVFFFLSSFVFQGIESEVPNLTSGNVNVLTQVKTPLPGVVRFDCPFTVYIIYFFSLSLPRSLTFSPECGFCDCFKFPLHRSHQIGVPHQFDLFSNLEWTRDSTRIGLWFQGSYSHIHFRIHVLVADSTMHNQTIGKEYELNWIHFRH